MGEQTTPLEEALGIRFRDAALREAALTHRSFAFEQGVEPTNERLEFLGDAVLGLVITDLAYRSFPELSEGDARLFAALKQLRGSIAREERVPAYVVFPDRTLAELAVRRPRTLSAMESVRGVGPAKLAKYGPRFLAAISDTNDTEAA